jgi:hypothetical protein
MGFAGHEAHMGVKKHAYSILERKLERHRFGLEYNINMDLKRIGNLDLQVTKHAWE